MGSATHRLMYCDYAHSVSTESSQRAAVQARTDRYLDDLPGWLAIPSTGSELRLPHHGAAAVAHLWRLLGALRS
jgi:hypothetical protein